MAEEYIIATLVDDDGEEFDVVAELDWALVDEEGNVYDEAEADDEDEDADEE